MIEVVHTAPLLTVQDTGRRGSRHLGVPLCGALDTPALRQANLLLGNLTQAAGLEITGGPLTLRSHGDHYLVLMGADMNARITLPASLATNAAPHPLAISPGFITAFPSGAVLHLTRAQIPGQRALLAFAGGIAVPRVMGSRSTDLNNGFGGFAGRSLRAGDHLAINPSATALLTVGVRQPPASGTLRCIRSLDYDSFKAATQSAFWHAAWQISASSNRMGLRLHGKPLPAPIASQRLSTGVLPGMIQVPPDGQPIVLAADAQTTGGYPVIASVIQADLWQLAYQAPGMRLKFMEVSIAEAQGLLAAQTQQRRLLAWRLRDLQETRAELS